MTEEVLSRDILQGRLEALKTTVERSQWKYYHIQGVQNFVYHINSFSSERTQIRMAGEINAYLSLIEERVNEAHDVHKLARELYPSVWRIADVYKNELGFIGKPAYLLYIAVWIALFLLLKNSLGTWVAFGLVAAIGILTIVRVQTKIKARKYF